MHDINHGFILQIFKEKKEIIGLLILADCLVQKYKNPK